MDQRQYSSLMGVLKDVADPRKARGKQLGSRFILGVSAAALLRQHRSAVAIAQWGWEHADLLRTVVQPARGRVPSESTTRRALQRVDVVTVAPMYRIRWEHASNLMLRSSPFTSRTSRQSARR